MDLRLPETQEHIWRVIYGAVSLAAAIGVLARFCRGPNLDAFPSIGSSTWLGSWWASFKYLTNAGDMVQEGYQKYKSAPFKVPEIYRWTVILGDRRCIEELARASEDDFSFLAAIDDQIQFQYVLGREIRCNPYHVAVVHSQLTRNIQSLYPDIRNEIVASFDEVLDLRGNEWKCVPAVRTIEHIICRTSNRAFVGLPLCRNADWIDLNIRYTVDVIKGGVIVGLFPTFMRPFAARFLTNIPSNIKRGAKLLGPIIEERKKYLNEYGTEWDSKPNDLVSWLMEVAEGPELTVERLTNRILVVNFAAIHSSSNTFTQALFFLAAHPQFVQPLREEVESIIERDGWTKVAMAKMHKVDSFLMECQRIEGLNVVTLSRKALKGYTFSNGTFIPKGTLVGAPTLSLHHDANFYANPQAFLPFRFVDVCEEVGDGVKHRFASTTTEYLPFGHGKHACPGRFFAANELKCMLAHTVVTYDVKLEDDATIPKSIHVATFIAVDRRAKIMFRNRID